MDGSQARASADEYGMVRREFGWLLRRWDIGQLDAAALAGCGESDLVGFLSGTAPLCAAAETRVRLLLDLGHSLDRLLPLTTSAAEWLRTAVDDCGGDAPIGILSGPTTAIRAVRNGLAAVLAGEA